VQSIRLVSILAFLCFGAAVPAQEEGSEPCAPCTLRVMSFNIEWGGEHVRFANVIEAIMAARADVVGVQEPEGNLERLANALGWEFNRRNHVISRFPLVDPPGGDGRFLFVEITPGRVVALANVHLPSDPYGPHWLREGRTPAEVIALERSLRLPWITPVLDVLAPIHARGVPVFLVGDFNAPSHEDWTEATVGKVPHRTRAFAWPVSRAVTAAGFRDAWRHAYPDPVAQPGFTWWAARPLISNYNPSDPADQERIDFVWFAGPATVESAALVGEAGGRDVSVTVSPWPSDHRAVVSEFRVEPAPMPVLVTSDQRVYRVGDAVRVTWEAPDAAVSVHLLHEADGKTTDRRLATGAPSGRIEVSTAGFAAGAYRLALVDADGRTLSRNDFWLLDPAASPALRVDGKTFAPGEPLPVSWRNAPGNRLDWLAVFDAEAPPVATDYLAYAYVRAESAGTLEFGARTVQGEWPLPPGRYVLRLLEDDGFERLAESAPFEVTGPGAAPAAGDR